MASQEEILAVQKTTDYLIDQIELTSKVSSEHDKVVIDKFLTLLKAVGSKPDLILGPESTDTASEIARQGQYASANTFFRVAETCLDRITKLKSAINVSEEMGIGMPSQKGMISALQWVHDVCINSARNLFPEEELKKEMADISRMTQELKQTPEEES